MSRCGPGRQRGRAQQRQPACGTPALAGAFGVPIGIAVPPIGVAGAVGLIRFFLGAIITLVRAPTAGAVSTLAATC